MLSTNKRKTPPIRFPKDSREPRVKMHLGWFSQEASLGTPLELFLKLTFDHLGESRLEKARVTLQIVIKVHSIPMDDFSNGSEFTDTW